MPKLDREEVDLVERAVAACAAEQVDQLTGRKFVKELLDFIRGAQEKLVPEYTILTGLWVVIHTLATEWRNDNERRS